MAEAPQTVVIVGAGQAGAQAAMSLRQGGFSGAIHLVGDEPALPYQRPPLSKGYLKGDLEADRLFLRPADYYAEHSIQLHLNDAVWKIDVAHQSVVLQSGQTLAWDRLVIATGARPRKLALPGADLEGVLDLRSLADVDRLKPYARAGVRAVIVGAGYIGLEAAAVLTQMGAQVTVLEAAPQVLGRVTGPEVAGFLSEAHRKAGVDVRVGQRLAAFTGAEGVVSEVRLTDGEAIACDVVLVGIGVVPNLEPVAEAGIACGNGVLVDRAMRTSVEGVYAIGDVAWRPLEHYGREGRLESVHNAIEGGKIAAADILGVALPVCEAPWFWSDQYDLKLQTVGLWTGADERVVRGEPSDGRFAVYYLKEGRVIAVDAINSGPDFIVGKKLVAAAATVDPAELRDTSISLKDISARALG